MIDQRKFKIPVNQGNERIILCHRCFYLSTAQSGNVFEKQAGDFMKPVIDTGMSTVRVIVCLFEYFTELIVSTRTTVQFLARKKHYSCIVCFESVDGEV